MGLLRKKPKPIIGMVEKVTVFDNNCKKKKTLKSRIDTGATLSSIHSKLAADLKLGPVIRTKVVKSANGSSERPVIKANIKVSRKKLEGVFTIADRSKMKYKMLIGQDILKKSGFLIDPKKPI